ncbi:hypothetical protein [Halomarina ordinaria]|uniref:Uncharacterized protein n=1 Tax=Halomarina ordinaria TaxID=3033939 RepID=A0ABD5U6U6_9EURY|nr:hypothetical protein [Halomarina sp. PSRA2]
MRTLRSVPSLHHDVRRAVVGPPRPAVRALADCSGHDLHPAVVHVQRSLRERHDAPEVEALRGEGLVRVVERDGFPVVHRRQPCATDRSDCPHGPSVYHVTTERRRRPDGGEDRRWTVAVGEVND